MHIGSQRLHEVAERTTYIDLVSIFVHVEESVVVQLLRAAKLEFTISRSKPCLDVIVCADAALWIWNLRGHHPVELEFVRTPPCRIGICADATLRNSNLRGCGILCSFFFGIID